MAETTPTPGKKMSKGMRNGLIIGAVLVVIIVGGLIAYHYWYKPTYIDKAKDSDPNGTPAVAEETIKALATTSDPKEVKLILAAEPAVTNLDIAA